MTDTDRIKLLEEAVKILIDNALGQLGWHGKLPLHEIKKALEDG